MKCSTVGLTLLLKRFDELTIALACLFEPLHLLLQTLTFRFGRRRRFSLQRRGCERIPRRFSFKGEVRFLVVSHVLLL
jgi:hypothetical protein